jgi:hypothetical protein
MGRAEGGPALTKSTATLELEKKKAFGASLAQPYLDP